MTTTAMPYADPAAPAAVEEARAALVADLGQDAVDVGEHLGQLVESGPDSGPDSSAVSGSDDARVVTHLFACTRKGYVGWRWSVTVAQVADGPLTIDELVLIPGDEAIVAPAWVPYRERIQPGDLSPGDLLPVGDDDPRLVPVYSFGDDPLDADAKAQVRQVSEELGLGRVRTLSPEGYDDAAERWYDGESGPTAPIAQAAPHHCHSCGFLVRIAGHLAAYFGVCANGDANDDGRVVSMDHGCGAHSEVRLSKKQEPQPVPDPVVDTLTDDIVAL